MLLEVSIAMPIVLVALGLFVRMLAAGSGLRTVAQDDWACTSAAQKLVEEMRNENFRDAFRLYNSDPFDDPGGPGTAPGNRFAVPELEPLPGELASEIGEVLMPSWNIGTELSPEWQVREDLDSADLGMPRDLNGDGMIDSDDHTDDYSIMPVMVRLRWQGKSGPREFVLYSALSELR